MIMKISFLFTLLIPVLSFRTPTSTYVHADEILGIWKNGSSKGHIQIFKNNDRYFGKIIWLQNPSYPNGQPKIDHKNPDIHQRNRPLIGLIMLRDFIFDDNEWNNGTIYNPADGKSYKAYIRLENHNTIVVRGYIGISIFGKTDVWTRVN